uniref:Uncharacterized protein n=1 Tax=viral metagenome TaxID=1070528 RepID=A0A6M3M6H0_9ZZZZ
MKTESNTRPEPVTIRKLGVIDTEPVVYLYLNSDITQEVKPDIDGKPRTMYMYDTVQITNPVPAELLPEIDLTLIADHSYNQTAVKQKTVNHLDKIRTRLGEATAENTRQVNRLDKLTTPKQVDLDNIKNRVLATKKTTPTTS